MTEENQFKFDASLIGLSDIAISPTQLDARKALKFMAVEAEMEVKAKEMEKSSEPDPLKVLNIVTAQEDLLDSANKLVNDVLHLNKNQKVKFENLSIQNCIVFAVKLAQTVLGVEVKEGGNQKS